MTQPAHPPTYPPRARIRSRRTAWLVAAAGLVLVIVVVALLLRSRSGVEGELEGYRTPTDAYSVVVVLTSGQGESVVRATAEETSDQVVVSVLTRASKDPRTGETFRREVSIQLEGPVAGRQVVSATGVELQVLTS